MSEQDLPARVAALERRLEEMEKTLGDKLDQLGRQLQDIKAFFGSRTQRMINAQSLYVGDHTALTFLETGQRIYVDTRSLDIGVHLLTLGRWESNYLDLFRRLVKPGDTVFDIGANHAFYTLHAAKLTGPTGRVEAFEPNPRLAELSAASITVNGYGRWVRLHRVAVGDEAGQAVLTFNPSMSGGGNIQTNPANSKAESVTVKVVTLDEMFPDPSYTVDVIKMDVEGYEGRALRGMARLLERSPNVRIMMEFAPSMMARAGVGASEVAAQFQGLGFSAWQLGAQGKLEPVSWGWLANQGPKLLNVLVAREAPG